MKPTPISQPDSMNQTPAHSLSPAPQINSLAPLIAFAAHPDDLEFAVGALLAGESRSKRPVHLVICSRGESATNGSPDQRQQESQSAAKVLGATIEFMELDGDAHLEIKLAHTLKIAAILRRHRPAMVLAPSTMENQHPDHPRLGRLIQDAARLARYAGVKELLATPPHTIQSLFFYAITTEAEPSGITPIFIDVSSPELLATWKSAMQCHASQTTRPYIDFQLTRAHLNGLRAGVTHAIAIYPANPIIVDSLAPLSRTARYF